MTLKDPTSIQIVDYDDNFVYIKATNQVANKLGAFYIQSKRLWKLPLNLAVIGDLRKETDIKLLEGVISKLNAEFHNARKIKNEEDVNGLDQLRPYQRVDVKYLQEKDRAAVFNEQRTGKTPTILTAVKDKLGKGIVVCPSSLKINWQLEYQRWVDDKPTKVISGSKKKRLERYIDFQEGDYKMLFISYETLRADIDMLLDIVSDFDVLIVDEAHRLRNYKSKQSKALYRLGKITKSIYPMTGTPAVNHPSDVYGILRLLNPSKFSSYWQFIERYFGYTEGRFGRELLDVRKDRSHELYQILEGSSVQRKRKEVMKWIPKIQNRKIPIELTPAQYKHLKKIKEEFMVGELDIPNVIAQITRMRQVTLDPGLLDLEGQSAKTEFIKDFIADNDGKIVIFSSFTSYLKRLKELIPEAELLTGEQSTEQKEEAVYNVQFGDSRILLSNIIVGGTGWTMDAIDTIIFADKSYNPIDNEQAADRIVPTDPDKTYGAKQIITLVGEKTIEQSINRLLDQKISIIKFVNEYGYNALVNYEGEENNNNAGVSNT